MSKLANLQDAMLNTIRKNKLDVTVFLVNGFQYKGQVKGYDNFVVILEVNGSQKMVYKHAISTIEFSRPITINMKEAMEAEAEESEDTNE